MQHMFSLSVDQSDSGEYSISADAKPVDLLQGVATECPTSPFGGSEDITVSRTHVVISARPELALDEVTHSSA